MDNYIVAGYLPGGLHSSYFDSDDYERRLALSLSEIHRSYGEDDTDVRTKWAKRVYQRLLRTPGRSPISLELGMGTCVASTESEAFGYIDNLSRLDTRRGRNFTALQNQAVCWDQPLLRAEFGYMKKASIPY